MAQRNPPGTPPLPITPTPTQTNITIGPVLSPTSWTPIGPASLNSQTVNGLVSGRIAGVAADPGNASIVYIAAAGGGVWKTANAGSTWTPLTDTQQTLAMGAIAVAPNNASKIYAGTGEANNAADSNYGFGILVSNDGGATWTLATGPANAFNRTSVARIAVDPTNANVAYAALGSPYTENGLTGNTGIWKTTDGGITWSNTTASIDTTYAWTDIAIDPTNTQLLYAAHGDPFGSGTVNGVYRSTNGGTSWTLLTGAPTGTTTGRFAIALAPSNHSVLYVAISNPSTNGLFYFGRSDNADTTATFTNLTAGTPNFLSTQGWYDIAVGVDPSNAAIVYVAGVTPDTVLRSATSGASWTNITTGGSPTFVTPHTDCHAIAFDAAGGLLLGNDGGIYHLDNPTTPAWSDYNGNLQTIQFTGVGTHPTIATSVVGGSQDNGTEVYSNNVVWSMTDGGDGGFAKYNPQTPSIVYHQVPNASFGSNFFRVSTDGGNTWSTRTTSISADVNNQNFYAPFVVDPGNGNRVLYGTDGVWETTNAGSSWTKIGTAGSGGFNPAALYVDAIGLARSNSNTIYAATGGTFASSSSLYVTTNHGSTWSAINLPSNGRVNEIDVDPATSTTAYAVVNTFNTGAKVWRTTNGGTTWTSMQGDLPAIPVWSLQIAAAPNTFFAGTDSAVYATTNGGAHWSVFGTGLPNAQAVQLDYNSNLQILAAGTHGRGAWEISVPVPSVTSVTTTTANGTYTVGASINVTVNFSAAVNVAGTPLLALNSGGTAAYASGSGTSTLTFTYTVGAGQNTAHLDYTSATALSLNGGTILGLNSLPANLTLAAPGAAGSLGIGSNLVIDTTPPTVVSYNVLFGTQSYNLIGSLRNRLPWQVTGIRVVFSKPVNAAIGSLTGVTASAVSGIGTNTVTWTITPLAVVNAATSLLGTGPNAITDSAGNALATFNQRVKVLWGDYNDDGVVTSVDMMQVNAQRLQPYNILADMNGDGLVNATDVNIVRTRLGTSLP